MPRVRNGKPEGDGGAAEGEGKKRASSAKKAEVETTPKGATTPAKKTAETTPAKKTADARFERLNLIERIRVGQRIAVLRTAPNPMAWKAISVETGVPVRTAQLLYKTHVEAMRVLRDPQSEWTIDEALLVFDSLIFEAAEMYRTSASEATKLGALRSVGTFEWRKLELLTATGRLRQRTGIEQQVLMLATFIARFEQMSSKFIDRAAEDLADEFIALGVEIREEFGYEVPEVLALGAGDAVVAVEAAE